MDLKALMTAYKVDGNENDPYERTKIKEKIGEKFIKKHNIWEALFPDYLAVKKVTTKKLQLDGVDFIITDATGNAVFVDIKVVIGPDYSTVPIEIRQNDCITFTSRKKTDYLLYIVIDDSHNSAILFDYDSISKLALRVAKAQAEEHKHIGQLETVPFEVFKSFNGTGEYIKFDYKNSPFIYNEVHIL